MGMWLVDKMIQVEGQVSGGVMGMWLWNGKLIQVEGQVSDGVMGMWLVEWQVNSDYLNGRQMVTYSVTACTVVNGHIQCDYLYCG